MKAGLLLSVFSLIICTGTAQAVPQTINDNFIGGRPNYTAGPGTSVPANYLNYVRDTYRNADVIGNPNSFNIESMTVDFTGTNTLSVVINSSFFDNIGELGVGIGDLFISTDGWSPVADTRDDYAGTGEDWEIAVQLDSRDSLAGALNAYNLVAPSVVLSSVAAPAAGHVAIYRGEQEVRYNANGESAIAGGNWAIDTNANTLTLNITFNNTFEQIGGAAWGFHYAMTCGNDVIEGAASNTAVPEPSTLLLFGSAIIGALPLRRKA